MTTTTTDDLMAEGSVTVGGGTREFGVSRSRLYEWMTQGKLPYSMTTGRRLIPRRAIRRLIEAGMVGTTEEKLKWRGA